MKLWEAFGAGVLVVVAATVVGCGGGAKPSTPQCVLNSDCAKLSTPGLVCAIGYCVKPCNISSDCPNSERCVVVSAGGPDASVSTAASDAGVAQGTACEAPELSTCNYTSMCKTPLVCSGDHQCRDQCETNVDCPMGQVCTSITHLCADPSIDKDYNSTINDFVVNDAGAGIPQGGTTGTGGNGTGGNGTGTGGSGHGGASGSGGGSGGAAGSVNVCPSPQTSFAITASGDPNTAFTSGIGVRDGNEIFVFSAYVTPPSDGGPMGNFIYVQHFLPGSNGNWPKAGPAVRLFQAADGPAFGIFDVSVAPTGEIVVLHSVGNGNGFGAAQGYGFSAGVNLYASFLNLTNTADGGTDGGVAGLEVVDTVQLESVEETMPHVIWSVSAQAFVISWKYDTTSWFTRVRKFHPNGQSAGGDTANVPTMTGTNNNYSWDESQVGTSGNLIGVAYANPASGSNPYLTLLDGDGLQVGNIIAVNPTNSSHWVSIGGTTGGFVTLFNNSSTVYGVFVPTSGARDVLTDGGTTRDAGGDAGLPGLFTDFSLPSTATTAKMVSDDTGGQGGVGAVLMETNGANFLYVTADGSKRLTSGTVISSAHGAEIGLTNYHGSFAVSLYDSTMHATQVVASGCSQ
jgi:hypothetical protein